MGGLGAGAEQKVVAGLPPTHEPTRLAASSQRWPRGIRTRVRTSFVDSLDEAAKQTVRREVYVKFSVIAPSEQDYFKQSTTRLHCIPDKLVQMTVDMYKAPKRMVRELSLLDLLHIGCPGGLGLPVGHRSGQGPAGQGVDGLQCGQTEMDQGVPSARRSPHFA